MTTNNTTIKNFLHRFYFSEVLLYGVEKTAQ